MNNRESVEAMLSNLLDSRRSNDERFGEFLETNFPGLNPEPAEEPEEPRTPRRPKPVPEAGVRNQPPVSNAQIFADTMRNILS